MSSKSYQVRIAKKDIDEAVKLVIAGVIERQIKKMGVDKDIEYEINDLTVDFNMPELSEKIKILDKIADRQSFEFTKLSIELNLPALREELKEIKERLKRLENAKV